MIKPKTLADKQYPAFIRNSSVIKKCGVVAKSFEDVGLPDYSVKYTHESKLTIEEFVRTLKIGLSQLPSIIARGHNSSFAIASIDTLRSELEKLVDKITVSSIKKGIRLVVPCAIRIPSYYRSRYVSYAKGSPLVGLLNSLSQSLEDFVYSDRISNRYRNLIDAAVNLELSWNKRLKVVFSTHPWDIATMSMRGISSCQAWGKAQSPCLIGSIVDPNMGIVYLTDGVAYKTYGPRMLARTVVRLTMPSMTYNAHGRYTPVSEKESKKRCISLENSYASSSSGPSQSTVFDSLFAKVIDEKVMTKGWQKKILSKKEEQKYFCGIPLTPEVKQTPEHLRSYRDSGLMYVPTMN